MACTPRIFLRLVRHFPRLHNPNPNHLTLTLTLTSDLHYGESPVCALCNYQTYVLYHLQQLSRLDSVTIALTLTPPRPNPSP